MKRVRNLLITAILLVAFALPSTATAEIIDRIVARVNDDIVTLNDVRTASVPFLLQTGQNPAVLQNPGERKKVLAATLEDLIDRKLLMQEAKKIDYEISDKELDQWLGYMRQQQNMSEEQYKQAIEGMGVSWADYRETARQNLLKMRMIRIKVGSQITITDDDVDARYREQFGDTPGQARYLTIQHILVRPTDDTPAGRSAVMAKLQDAYQRIQNGESFDEVAKAVSEGPSASRGGFIGEFKRGDLDPAFEEAAWGMEVGAVSQPVETKFGFHLIRVVSESLKDDVDVDQRKEMIRAQIQQEEMDRLLKQYMSELRTKAFVEITY